MFDMVASHDLLDPLTLCNTRSVFWCLRASALLDHTAIGTFPSPPGSSHFQYPFPIPDARMDRLHELVTAAVQEGTQKDENQEALFHRLQGLAYELSGRPAPAASYERVSGREKAPRLTESWFCCAEPTQGQFRPLRTTGHEAI